MSEVKLQRNLVLKMKALPGGINPELDRIRTEYAIEVDFDGKEVVRLRHKDNDFLEVAVQTLERSHGFPTNYEEVQGSIVRQNIEWIVTGSSAWKMEYLFDQELQTLEKIKSCEVKKDDQRKEQVPKEISILCNLSDFCTVNEIVKQLTEKCKNVRPVIKNVEKREHNKATRFCRGRKWSGVFCYFDVNEGALYIYSLHEKLLDKVFEDWNNFETEKQQRELQNEAFEGTSKSFTGSLVQNKAKADNNPLTHVESKKISKSDNFVMSVKGGKDGSDSSTVHNENKEPKQNDKVDIDFTGLSGRNSILKPDVGKASSNHDWDSPEEVEDISLLFPDRKPGQKSKDGKYEFTCGKIKVFAYRESVTDVKGMDAVTNAANEKLMHGGGVAYYISKAAGKKMCDECNDYITKYGAVKVTQNYVSKGGDMKCKGIIHAVGPKWYDYRGRRTECARDVYQTIWNCLKVSEEHKWKKIALIAISSGIFGVPKQLCAEMYVKALIDFGIKDSNSMREVHFIDVNQDILDMIEKAHKDWVQNPDSISFDNALNYEDAPSYKGKKTVKHKGDTDFDVSDKTDGNMEVREKPLVLFVRKERERFQFCIAGILDLHVYSGSVLELGNVDAIVCSMDVHYEGVLLKKITDMAGKVLVNKLQSRQKDHKRCEDGEVCIFPGGNMKVKHVLALAIDGHIKGANASDLERLHGYFTKIIKKAEDIKAARVALPMIGCGYVRNPLDLHSCCRQLIKTITLLCTDNAKNGQTTNIEEIHLVNYDENFTKYLLQILHDLEKGDGSMNGAFPTEDHGQGFDPRNPHGWTLHKPLKDVSVQPPIKEESNITATSIGKTSQKGLSKNCFYFKTCNKMAVQELACGHAFCKSCMIKMKKGCKVCMVERKSSQETKPDASVIKEKCPVCLETFQNLKVLPCNHKLCESCLSQLQVPKCPVCFHIFGIITGNQPDGQMYYRTVTDSLPGYQSYGTIEIAYVFPDGIQKENHPDPGCPYIGTQRQAYLPDSPEGQKVLHLLRRSFDRRLTFTVGMSRTSGKENRVTYNDIHHKTRKDGGAERYGYPDPDYLQRVQEELKAKAVVQ